MAEGDELEEEDDGSTGTDEEDAETSGLNLHCLTLEQILNFTPKRFSRDKRIEAQALMKQMGIALLEAGSTPAKS